MQFLNLNALNAQYCSRRSRTTAIAILPTLRKMSCRFPIQLSLRLPMVFRTNSSGLVFRRLSTARKSRATTVASLPPLKSAVAVQVWSHYEPRTLTLDAVDSRDREAIAQALRPLYVHSGAMKEAFRAAAVDKALWPHVRSDFFPGGSVSTVPAITPGFRPCRSSPGCVAGFSATRCSVIIMWRHSNT